MNILAVDPGPKEGAYLMWDPDAQTIVQMAIVPNDGLLNLLRTDQHLWHCYIEMIACYGMAVGKEVFETCLFIGRVQEITASRFRGCTLIYRSEVKQHHCHTARALDSNISQALRDKYGDPGKKSAPGKLYGVKSHLWSALAIATMVSEKMHGPPDVEPLCLPKPATLPA